MANGSFKDFCNTCMPETSDDQMSLAELEDNEESNDIKLTKANLEAHDNKKAKFDLGEPKCDEDAKEKANRDKNANDNNLEAQVLNLIDKAAKRDEDKEATHVWWCPSCGASPSYYCATECDGQQWIQKKRMVDGKAGSSQEPKRPNEGSKRKSNAVFEDSMHGGSRQA